jgi:hypothetical protein
MGKWASWSSKRNFFRSCFGDGVSEYKSGTKRRYSNSTLDSHSPTRADYYDLSDQLNLMLFSFHFSLTLAYSRV